MRPGAPRLDGRRQSPHLGQPRAQEVPDLGLDPDRIRPPPLVEPEGAAAARRAFDAQGPGAAHRRDPT